MKSFELWLLGYLLNSLWQIPIISLAAWLAARLLRRTGPRVEHRIWVVALILDAVLPACQFRPEDLWWMARGLLLSGVIQQRGEARIVLGDSFANGTGLHLPPLLFTTLLIAYSVSLVYFTVRLAWGFSKTCLILRHSTLLSLQGDLADSLLRSSCILKKESRIANHGVEIWTCPAISGPVTVGLRRRILLVPPEFLESITAGDMDALLAHEFAHMRRSDFAKNLLYGIFSLPVSYHPLLWITRARVAETRELVCDAMAADAIAGRESYARSLLRLAAMLSESAPGGALHAVAIFDTNNFERRIMDLRQKQVEIRGMRRLAIMAVCGTIALAACASALALRMEVADSKTQTPAATQLKVNVKDLKILHNEPPVYPAEAKASGNPINGQVLLEVIIGKTGEVENIRVKKSLRADYDKNAIDAVRNWRWEPYLLNGEPVEVITTVSIIYSLKK